MATLEGPGLPTSQTATMRPGNLPSKASLDSSTPPTPASPHSARVLLLQPSSPLAPSPAKPTHAPPSAGFDIVPSPVPSSPSPKLQRGLLYSSSHFPRHTYSGPRKSQWRSPQVRCAASLSCSPRVLGHSCSSEAVFFFLLSIFKSSS